MQIASGLVTALNLILALLVGVRLLRQSGGRWSRPELPLAAYFLLSAVVATALQVPAYGSLSEPMLAGLVPYRETLLGVSMVTMHLGVAGVFVFTVRTFRPEEPWARGFASFGIGMMFAGTGFEGFYEGFEVAIYPGPGHWIGWTGRTLAFVWVACEAFRYWRRMRRREALGLAEPLVTNRFFLWGVWSVAGFLLFASDLAARGLYWWLAGTEEIVMSVLQPLVAVTIAVTMVVGMVGAVTLFLTFFPTAAYRRWLATGREAVTPTPLSD